MSASVAILGLDELTGRVKTWPVEIDRAVHEQVLVETRPLVSHMKGRAGAVGGSARLAARGLRIASTQDGVSVVADGSDVLMGAEFGSKVRKKVAYVTRSRKGRGYIAKRRTKLQFKPFLGTRGYWFWPTVRTDLKGINARVGAIITGVARGER
jgi:hypothetical protein